MRRSVKLCVTALTAALLLASAVATSSARNLSISNQNITATWLPLEFISGGRTLRCRLTLEGSFHARTIQKSVGTLLGAITRANFSACTSGTFWAENGVERAPLGTLANTLPWGLTYEGFLGRLPSIAGVYVLLRRMRIVLESEFLGFRCVGRYGTESNNQTLLAEREAGGALTTLSPVTGRGTLSLVNQLGSANVCPSSVVYRGPSHPITLLGTTTRITVTLI